MNPRVKYLILFVLAVIATYLSTKLYAFETASSWMNIATVILTIALAVVAFFLFLRIVYFREPTFKAFIQFLIDLFPWW